MTSESMHTTSKEMVPHAPANNYHLKGEVSIMQHELSKKHLCDQSSHYENVDKFKGSHYMLLPNQHLLWS